MVEYNSLRSGEPTKYYRPLIHHTTSLCLILIIALGLIGLTEYALRVLPQHKLSPGKSYGQMKKRNLLDWRELKHRYGGAHPGAMIPVPNPATLTSSMTISPPYPSSIAKPTHPGLRKRTPPKAGHANSFGVVTVTATVVHLKVYQKKLDDDITDTIKGASVSGHLPAPSAALLTELSFSQPPKVADGKHHKEGGEAHAPGNVTIITTTTSDSTTYLDTRAMRGLPLTAFLAGDIPQITKQNGVGDKSQQGDGDAQQNGGDDAKPKDNKDGPKGGNDGGVKGVGDGGGGGGGGGDGGEGERAQGHGGGDRGHQVEKGGDNDPTAPGGGGGVHGGGDQDNGNGHGGGGKSGAGKLESGHGDSGKAGTKHNGEPSLESGEQKGEGGSDTGRDSLPGDHVPTDNALHDKQSIDGTQKGNPDSANGEDTGLDANRSGLTDSTDDHNDGSSSSGHGLGKSAKYGAPSDDKDGVAVVDHTYTTTIDGHEVIVTPTASRHSKGHSDNGLAQEPYTTTIDGHEVVVTPRPSKSGKGSKNSDPDDEVIVASVKGKSKLTTLTLSKDRARPSQTGKASSNAKVDNSKGSHNSVDPSHEKLTTYAESDKPLTFVESAVNYFYGIYLPILLTVAFQMIAGYLYTATKMMEPFAMLSTSRDGIAAKDFLWINYLCANDSIEPFIALASGHWLMLWVSILYTLAQLLSPLSSEMLGIYPGYKVTEDTVDAGACTFIRQPPHAQTANFATPSRLDSPADRSHDAGNPRPHLHTNSSNMVPSPPLSKQGLQRPFQHSWCGLAYQLS